MSGLSVTVRPAGVPAGQPTAQPDQRVIYWHFAVLLALPWILLVINRNWAFQDLGHMDPWYYFGNFLHFPRFQKLNPNYAGERLLWILPGYLLVRLASPVYGTLLLHVVSYCTSLFCLYSIVKRFSDARTAVLASCLLGCHPFFIAANGWDYVDGACVSFFFISLRCLVAAVNSRRQSLYLLLAGVSWAAVVYTYIAWIIFTPAVLYFYWGLYEKHKRSLGSLAQLLAYFTLGVVAITALLEGIHLLIFRTGFFFRINWLTAISVGTQRYDPWVSPDPHWYTSASQLVFPVAMFVASIVILVRHRFSGAKLNPMARTSIIVYIYCFLAMVLMTIHPSRLLQFDYFADILLPPLFVALSTTVLAVPRQMKSSYVYALILLSCAISLIQLANPGLYRVILLRNIALPLGVAAMAMVIRVLWPIRKSVWMVAVLLIAIATLNVVPVQPAIAWRMKYNGMATMIRASRAVRIISDRIPPGRNPVFWINIYDQTLLSPEYTGIMCAFVVHGWSMWKYPSMDVNRLYVPGTPLILLTANKDVFDDANSKMTERGMPLQLVGQDLISRGHVSYWVTTTIVTSAPPKTGGR